MTEWRIVILAALLPAVLFVACRPAIDERTDSADEPQAADVDFGQQLALVRAGDRDRIEISHQSIGDQDLKQLDKCENLRELILDGGEVTDIGVAYLTGLVNLEHVRLRNSPITDKGIAHLARLPKLRILNLPNAEFSDAALAELAENSHLTLLRFHSDHVTDVGMQHISRIDGLRFLHLIDVPISDRGIRELESMKNLESLYLDHINVTDDALSSLLKALPELHFHKDQQHLDLDPRKHSHSH